MSNAHTLLVPVATGELIDKITILRLKASRLLRPEALANVQRELRILEELLAQADAARALINDQLSALTDELQTINTKLWDVEDGLRLLEAEQKFDAEFIHLARSVYQLNDHRSAIKRQINICCGSDLMEEKSYGELPQYRKAMTMRNEKSNA